MTSFSRLPADTNEVECDTAQKALINPEGLLSAWPGDVCVLLYIPLTFPFPLNPLAFSNQTWKGSSNQKDFATLE